MRDCVFHWGNGKNTWCLALVGTDGPQASSGAGGNFNGERWQEEASVVGPARRGNTPGRGSGGGEVVIKFGPFHGLTYFLV